MHALSLLHKNKHFCKSYTHPCARLFPDPSIPVQYSTVLWSPLKLWSLPLMSRIAVVDTFTHPSHLLLDAVYF